MAHPSVERGDDQEWGLTDCISFIVMGNPGLTDALTADEHFEQAGFRALLRENVQVMFPPPKLCRGY
ncbi:MAG: hypothetical protein ACNYVW_09390 [Methanosarcinales archaeon]